jgi:hypothetical protein
VLSFLTIRYSSFLQTDTAAARTAEAYILIAPAVNLPHSTREDTPTGYNEIPSYVFMHFIAQYMWEAYGLKTWTPNKFHQI